MYVVKDLVPVSWWLFSFADNFYELNPLKIPSAAMCSFLSLLAVCITCIPISYLLIPHSAKDTLC